MLASETKPTWIQTWSGRAFDLANPTPEQVYVEDIAAALKKIPRFTGHTGWIWTVYDHTMLVCSIVSDKGHASAVPYALLHDAHEAYVGDWSTPLKNALGADYTPLNRLEARIAKAIHTRAGLDWPPPLAVQEIVKEADKLALMWERRDCMILGDPYWGEELETIAASLPLIKIEKKIATFYTWGEPLGPFERHTPKLFHPYTPAHGGRA